MDATSRVSTTIPIPARMDRLPMTGYQRRLCLIIGAGMFFDGFDLLMIGIILPFLTKSSFATSAQTATLVSDTALGLLVGSLLAGWLGDHAGRKALYQFNLAIYALGTIACAFAPSFTWLLVLRLVASIGLGGEVVSGYGMFSEFVPAANRGRWAALLALTTNIGYPVAAAVGAVAIPAFGWRSMFIIAGVPALVIWVLRRQMPESPRWLERRGRAQDADRVMRLIETRVARHTGGVLPEPKPVSVSVPGDAGAGTRPPRFALVRRGLLGRTVVAALIWIFAVNSQWGFTQFAPTLLAKGSADSGVMLHLELIVSLGAIPGVLLGSWLSDAWGRRPVLITTAVAAVPLGIGTGLTGNPVAIAILGFGLAVVIYAYTAVAVAVYVPELFPTEVRLSGNGVATALGRAGLIAMPFAMTAALGLGGTLPGLAFVACLSAALAITCLVFPTETRGRSLEDIETSVRARWTHLRKEPDAGRNA